MAMGPLTPLAIQHAIVLLRMTNHSNPAHRARDKPNRTHNKLFVLFFAICSLIVEIRTDKVAINIHK